jgi:hypothetical protein
MAHSTVFSDGTTAPSGPRAPYFRGFTIIRTRWDSSVWVIGPSQRPLRDNTQHSQETDMSPLGFEPTIPGSERPQTHALDRAATAIDHDA